MACAEADRRKALAAHKRLQGWGSGPVQSKVVMLQGVWGHGFVGSK
jgi:hypothetical protein